MSDSIFFNAKEAAEALGISAETVRAAVHSGELKAHRGTEHKHQPPSDSHLHRRFAQLV